MTLQMGEAEEPTTLEAKPLVNLCAVTLTARVVRCGQMWSWPAAGWAAEAWGVTGQSERLGIGCGLTVWSHPLGRNGALPVAGCHRTTPRTFQCWQQISRAGNRYVQPGGEETPPGLL